MDIKIRWFIRRDMEEVLTIDSLSFRSPWSEEDILSCLRQRNCIGMVAYDSQDYIRGFMIYELHKTDLRIINLAVHPAFRRKGIGRAMTQRLAEKLSQQRRDTVLADVRETNLNAQLFFHACGYRAEGVGRGHYEDTGEDVYHFAYRMRNRVMRDGGGDPVLCSD